MRREASWHAWCEALVVSGGASMDPKRTLVVYYSRTGTTHEVAEAIRNELGCEIDRIVDRTHRRGILGYLRSGLEAVLHRRVALGESSTVAGDYDLVIVGTPIWNASVSAPVRTYLHENRDRIRNVAFFCSYGGSGSTRTFRQMQQVCGQRPLAKLAVKQHEVHRPGFAEKVRAFASAIRGTRVPETRPGPTELRPAPV
jgi:flavodoxin